MALTGRGRMIKSAWHQKYDGRRGMFARLDFTRAEWFGIPNTNERDMWLDWFFDTTVVVPDVMPIVLMGPPLPPTPSGN